MTRPNTLQPITYELHITSYS